MTSCSQTTDLLVVGSATPAAVIRFAAFGVRLNEWDVTAYLQAQKAAGRSTVTLVLKNLANSTPFDRFGRRKRPATGRCWWSCLSRRGHRHPRTLCPAHDGRRPVEAMRAVLKSPSTTTAPTAGTAGRFARGGMPRLGMLNLA
jgi:hypothetical protein